MKAVVLYAPMNYKVEDLEDPLSIPFQALGVGQVKVKVLASTICGAQIREITGVKGPDNFLPHLMGHEGCGIVMSVGPGVTRVSHGDKVIMHWRKGLGIDAKPYVYHKFDGIKDDYKNYVRIGSGPITTFAEMVVVSENRLTKIEDDIPSDVACLFGCAVTTGLGLINNEAQLKIGQSIAVIGVGGVGLSIIQGASMVSGNPIIAVDKVQDKLVMARQFGATHTINNLQPMNIVEGIASIVGHKGVDVLVDCTGNLDVIDESFRIVKPGGKMILAGQPKYNEDLILLNMSQHYCGKTLMDSQGGLTDPFIDIPRYLDLYRQGKLVNLENLITHRFPLEEFNKAVDLMLAGASGRVLLEMPF